MVVSDAVLSCALLPCALVAPPVSGELDEVDPGSALDALTEVFTLDVVGPVVFGEGLIAVGSAITGAHSPTG